MTPKNIICLQCYCSDCWLLTLAEQIPNQNKNSHSWLWSQWKSCCFGVAKTGNRTNNLSSIDWMMRRACLSACVSMCERVCHRACAHFHVDVLDMQHIAGKDNFSRMPHRYKKVIDANVEKGREGNRANQLIKHFIRLGEALWKLHSFFRRQPFSASADNAVILIETL